MARNRMIKPDFWTSEQIVKCSLPARLMFIGLWNFSDDGGVHPVNYVRLKIEIFPADSFSMEEITGWMNELVDAGLVETYLVDTQEFWRVTGWHHQTINRPTYQHPKSRELAEEAAKKRNGNYSNSMSTHGALTEHSRSAHQERNGTETNVSRTERTETKEKKEIRSFDRTPDKIFYFDSEKQEFRSELIEKAKSVAKRLWPRAVSYRSQDQDEVMRACSLSAVLISESWLEASIESTVLAKPNNPGAYFRKCLIANAETHGYDYHKLVNQVIFPAKKPKD